MIYVAGGHRSIETEDRYIFAPALQSLQSVAPSKKTPTGGQPEEHIRGWRVRAPTSNIAKSLLHRPCTKKNSKKDRSKREGGKGPGRPGSG